MFFITAAVGFVTAGFFENLFGVSYLGDMTIVILFAVCVSILAIGKYNALDSMIKVIAITLLVSTTSAFLLVLSNGPIEPVPGFEPKVLWTSSGFFFLLALMGFMPTPLDISSWNSLWTLERIKQSKYVPKLRETLFEFRLAYLITIVTAVMFVTLGAFLFYGSGQELPNNNSLFAHNVVTSYTQTIGQWSHLIISASAFAVMFGTILAIFDGYSRSLHRTVELIVPGKDNIISRKQRIFYILFLLILSVGSLAIIFQFDDNFKDLVDFATTLSFVIAPVIAVFNYRLATGRFLPKELQPYVPMKVLSVAGIVFLVAFVALFVSVRFLGLTL